MRKQVAEHQLRAQVVRLYQWRGSQPEEPQHINQ
jgi:hypothetical protein